MAGAYSQTLSTFFSNIFFLQTITAPVFGSNGPLWSLANEFWYYLLFPLMTSVVAITGNYRTSTRLILAVVLIIILWLLPSGIIEGFFVWLMGVAIYALSGRFMRKRRPLHLVVALVVFCLSLVYSKLDSWESAFGLNSDLVVGFGFSVLCIVIACWSSVQVPPARLSWRSLGRMTSEFSYSLYLVHFPVLVFLSVSVLPALQMNTGAIGYAVYFGAMALLVGSGFLFWLAFERKTSSIRRFILAKMPRFGLA